MDPVENDFVSLSGTRQSGLAEQRLFSRCNFIQTCSKKYMTVEW